MDPPLLEEAFGTAEPQSSLRPSEVSLLLQNLF
jgi:hypothetical protein